MSIKNGVLRTTCGFLFRIKPIKIEDITCIFSKYDDISTQIICASVRNPMQIVECAKYGADIATVPFKVLMQMMCHPLTDQGIEKFKADYQAVFGK